LALRIVKTSKYIDKKLLENAVKEVFSYLDEEFEVNVKFVSEDYIHDLNKKHIGKDEPTNVLSFNHDNNSKGGDIVICEAVVGCEASKFNYKPEELSLLYMVHGILHLAGLDHTNEVDRAKMELVENKILSKLGVKIERD